MKFARVQYLATYTKLPGYVFLHSQQASLPLLLRGKVHLCSSQLWQPHLYIQSSTITQIPYIQIVPSPHMCELSSVE